MVRAKRTTNIPVRSFRSGTVVKALKLACYSWHNPVWHDLFIGDANPLLADPSRFNRFCLEYSVGRTIRKGKRHEFRKKLLKEIPKAKDDTSGNEIDKLEQLLRSRFGMMNGKKRMTSVISKVAVFYRPEVFIAWDRLAKKGLNLALGRPASKPFHSYAEYMREIERLWQLPVRQQIEDAALQCPRIPPEWKLAFARRVLDVTLMIHGGRRFPVARPAKHSGKVRTFPCGNN